MRVFIPTIAWLFLAALLLQACSLGNRKTEASAEQLLLEQQAEQLEQQNRRLDELVLSQQQMLAQLESYRQAINGLSQQLNGRSETSEKVAAVAPAEIRTQQNNRRMVTPGSGKLVLGRVEWAWLDVAASHFKARIDTGSPTSKLHVNNLQLFERNGDAWVRFKLDGLEEFLQAPRKNGSKKPLVSLMVRMGTFAEQADFVLHENTDELYKVELGRNFLRDIAMVDVSKKFTQPKVTLTLSN